VRTRMSDISLAKIRYSVFSGALFDHFTFNYWREKWPALISKLGQGEKLHDDEFLRQDTVTTLTLDDRIVGIHLLSEFNRDQFRVHPYFKSFDEKFLAALDAHQVRRLQTLQYFMVDEAFSVSNTLVNFGAIIASLSLRHQVEKRLDASITLARSDIPVTSLGLKLGFEEISKTQMHGVPVSMLACFRPVQHPKADVQAWVNFYWNHREYHNFGSYRKRA
jgi:hypothetical protein